ncbi:MAG TPA: response regulator [Methylomirabilota bacterium]|jgi:CheY-like chemotaxis protein|nr:response regulator [Methylomirabilota bacterium]
MASQLVCPRCSKPIGRRQAVQIQQGELIHVRCASQASVLRAMELRAQARAATVRVQQLAEETARRRAAEAGPLRGLTILVVDDHEDTLDAMRLWLNAYGARTLAAGTGADAVGILATLVPDVVMADLGLPDMDGYALARHIRANPALARVCLIAVSGRPADEAGPKARDVGFDEYFIKPVNLADLVGALVRRRPLNPRRPAGPPHRLPGTNPATS